MRSRHLNYENIATACDKIKNRGEKPSLINLSNELGKTKVTGDLADYLEQWYHLQPEFKRLDNNPLSENLVIDTSEIIEKNIELEKSLSIVRATLESTADGIMMVNGKGRIVDWNQKFVEMWRIPSYMMEDGAEKLSFDYILDQVLDPEGFVGQVQALYEDPTIQGYLNDVEFKDGRVFERYSQPQRIGNEIVGRVFSFRDITTKKLAERELLTRQRAIEASSHGVAILDMYEDKYTINYVNPSFERITGYNFDEISGKYLSMILGEKTNQVNHKRIDLAIREQRDETVELECYRQNGELYWVELSISPVKENNHEMTNKFVCLLNDVTERHEMELQLINQATHDSLTHLPNRSLLIDRVNQAVMHAKKSKKKIAMLFLDLDNFKLINDTLGHGMGDKLLQAMANRLIISTSDQDTVSRLGGDEFIVLLTELDSDEQAKTRACELLEIICKPFQIEQHNLKLTTSIGISFYPDDGGDYESLMKSADLSMYYAKDSGRNNYQVYKPEMNQRVINHMQLDNALRDALQLNEFTVHYQPLIDINEQTVIGTEALIRWNSHQLGLVPPLNFIPLAEENGLIIDIGNWVLEQACQQTVNWHKMGFKHLTVAVNISGRQFKQANLAQIIQDTLNKTGLDPKYLELELTESLLIEDIKHVVEIMHQMKDMGVSVAIDDFGTGYSSLAYLKQFPADKLKIDRSFITDLVNDDNEAAIAKAIINLGHSLNMHVLAEGIENEGQLDFMKRNHCDFAQGYYFQRPDVAENVVEYLIGIKEQ